MFALLLFSSGPVISQSLGGIGAGTGEEKCTIKVLGIDTPCTRIWCSSTMAMTACGAGDINSQKCDKAKGC